MGCAIHWLRPGLLSVWPESGLLGDWKTVGDGVSEVRVDHGPGYRLYFTIRNRQIVILLCGSDKRDQGRAIKLAKRLAKTV